MSMVDAVLDTAVTCRELVEVEDDQGDQQVQAPAKRKRSWRHARAPTEEEHLALCLLMLARGHRDSDQHRAPTPVPEHRCSMCGKVFPSHQALGGHKSSHRSRPSPAGATTISAAAAREYPATAVVRAAPSPSPATSSTSGAVSRVHECSVCKKTFPTGQALGGHKRCHYEGTIGVATAIAVTASRGFDLNIPALPDLTERCFLPAAADDDEEVLSPLAFKKPAFMIPA
jgi:hypothetical protein